MLLPSESFASLILEMDVYYELGIANGFVRQMHTDSRGEQSVGEGIQKLIQLNSILGTKLGIKN